jgi:hypothetical protein
VEISSPAGHTYGHLERLATSQEAIYLSLMLRLRE